MSRQWWAGLFVAILGALLVFHSMDLSPQRKEVVVVGGGLAGMSAALSAAEAGAHVTIVEKEKRLGGNSGKATSGINGARTDVQKSLGVDDSEELFTEDTMVSGHGRSKQELVEKLVHDSADAVAFLQREGVPLAVVSRCGGHSRERTHRCADRPDQAPIPVGWEIVRTLKKAIEGNGAIDIVTEAHMTSLTCDSSTVTGVEVVIAGEKKTYKGDAVVLTTGGFAGNHNGVLGKHRPDLVSLPTTNGPWATGDGLQVAVEAGASLVDMDQVQVHPTGLLNATQPRAGSVILGPEALRASGGLLVNGEGKKFIDELKRRDEVTAAIIEQNTTLSKAFPGFDGGSAVGGVAYLVMDRHTVAKFGPTLFSFYQSRGLFHSVVGVGGLSEVIGCSKESLTDSLTGLTLDEELFVAAIVPAVHYTMGGVEIDAKGRALSAEKQPIVGLFAAGEVTGGVHGANRLAGNSLLECVVFGREAGRNAATM